ncbi:MAG: BMP family ABC transporter substrate-binding protein, partial [Chloroflexi bacterium]
MLVVLLLVAACGGAAQPQAETSGGDSGGEPLKVLLFINGVLGDKSFFDSAQRGMDRAEKELGAQTKTIEAGLDETQWESALVDAAANEDYDVLVVGTFQMISYLEQVAPQYPDKKFIIFDAPVNYESGCCDNVYSVLYKQNEGSYLAGVYAAAMTTQQMD